MRLVHTERGLGSYHGKFFDVAAKVGPVSVISLTGCLAVPDQRDSKGKIVNAYTCAGSAEGKENDGAQWRQVGKGIFKNDS